MPSRKTGVQPAARSSPRVRKSDKDKAPQLDTTFYRTFYEGLREYEQHFDSMEFEVRKIASTWMALIFAAVAFILRGEFHPTDGVTSSAPLLCLIPLFGNVGLFALLMLEQRVYHNLLNAPFLIGLQLEVRHPEIPPIRSQMWRNSQQRGMIRFQVLFYALPMCVIATVGLVSAAHIGADRPGQIVLRIAALFAALIPLWVIARTWVFGLSSWTRFLAEPELPNFEIISSNVDKVLKRWEHTIPDLRR